MIGTMAEKITCCPPLAPAKQQKIAPSLVNRGHAPRFSAAC
jgi:hypothetical protein